MSARSSESNPTPAGKPAGSRFAALTEPAFRRYWLGSIGTIGSTQLLFIGMGWLVFQLTGSPFDLGLVGLCLSLPAIAFSFIGGGLADTLDRRRILFATNLALAIVLLALAIADRLEVVEAWHVLIAATAYGIIAGFDWPTRQSFFPTLLPPEKLPSAVALMSMLWQGGRMAIPAIGGTLIAAGGTAGVFALGALGSVAMCAVLYKLPSVAKKEPEEAPGLPAGIRFILHEPLFFTLIGLTWALSFFGISYMQIMPALADLLGAGSRGFGAMVSASGVGSLMGTALVMMRRPHIRNPRRFLLSALTGAGCGLAAFALVCWNAQGWDIAWYLAVGIMVLTHTCASIFYVMTMIVLQQNVPEHLRGRVMGVHGIGFTLIMLGGVFSGGMATLLHPAAAVLIGSIILLIATAIGNRWLP
ncbi:MFS transporter [Thioalkalivibrio sp. HK1]|uniref:MFS transporter n=1 Tax=Thioalkalivibrio sp. HK1 TaxID=1469245 RepID=UPI000471EB57|nr:MFS transporter [Thioalkalivibrio sp. HK1]